MTMLADNPDCKTSLTVDGEKNKSEGVPLYKCRSVNRVSLSSNSHKLSKQKLASYRYDSCQLQGQTKEETRHEWACVSCKASDRIPFQMCSWFHMQRPPLTSYWVTTVDEHFVKEADATTTLHFIISWAVCQTDWTIQTLSVLSPQKGLMLRQRK